MSTRHPSASLQSADPRHLTEAPRQSARSLAKTLGTFVLAGGGTSSLLGAGAFTAQQTHGLNAATVLAMYFVVLLVCVINAAVKVCEILNRRTPEQIRAAAMARLARKHPNPDLAMRLLKADRPKQVTSEHSFELLRAPAEAASSPPARLREPAQHEKRGPPRQRRASR
jgi:hypothetical protein